MSGFYNKSLPRDRYVGCVSIAQHPVFFEFIYTRNLSALSARLLHFVFSKPKCWQVSPSQLCAAWNISPDTIVDAIKDLFKACPELKVEKGDWGFVVDASELYDKIYDQIMEAGEDRWH